MIAGLGQVLVDSSGDALYSPDQEAGGKVLCTGSCASIWLPLTLPASAGKPTATDALASKLGVVKRPDGANQVTFAGKPLYRFVEDSGPGEVSGNGLADTFDGKKFTWHVAGQGGASSSSAGSRSGYGS
jgi:predicted lipoprotein with Yx(FWY)xxD motif